MPADKQQWRSLVRRAQFPLLIVLAGAVAVWDATGWDAPLVGESPFRGSDDEPERIPAPGPAESEDDVLGEWEGVTTIRLSGGRPVTYTLRLTISSLDPGEVSGQASADYGDGGHCGGTMTLQGEAAGGYRFGYREEDNPGACTASSEILLVPTEGGMLRYRETSEGLAIEGTLTRAGPAGE